MWKALCCMIVVWNTAIPTTNRLTTTKVQSVQLEQSVSIRGPVQSARYRYCSLTVAICRRKTGQPGNAHLSSPTNLTGTWACIVWAESRDTNTNAGDGGGYFQFEPATWAWLTSAMWPPTLYSFTYQYRMAQKLQASQWGWTPWESDGCIQ
jgi:hypothetical protein